MSAARSVRWVAGLARRLMVVTLGTSVAGLSVAGPSVAGLRAAADPAPLRYRPPVTAPITDPFRAPANWFGPGNRGIEYDTSRVEGIGAIGAGTVSFAGSVARRLVVVVSHPDGLRSSYTGLGSIEVRVGDRVAAGQRIGRAGPRLHLGLRDASSYLDPERYFAPQRRHAVLVGPFAPTLPARAAGPSRARPG